MLSACHHDVYSSWWHLSIIMTPTHHNDIFPSWWCWPIIMASAHHDGIYPSWHLPITIMSTHHKPEMTGGWVRVSLRKFREAERFWWTDNKQRKTKVVSSGDPRGQYPRVWYPRGRYQWIYTVILWFLIYILHIYWFSNRHNFKEVILASHTKNPRTHTQT